MNRKLEKVFERYHSKLVPTYSRICDAHGIKNAPGVLWLSLVGPEGQPLMAARILWNEEDPGHVDPVDIYCNPGPDDVIAAPRHIAERVALRVVNRMGSGN